MKKVKSAILLVLTALIWGVAFVAQTTGGDAAGPYTFNCVRSFIGAIVLLPVIKFLDGKGLSGGKPETAEGRKHLIIGGILCGVCLGSASLFQQVGISMGTAAGKAGFLTACYIVLVPVIGLFLHKKCGLNIWVAVAITVAGLYLLCMSGELSLQTSDTLILICSVLFALQILCIDHFVSDADPVRLSCIQFLTAGIISAVPTFIIDMGCGRNMAAWAGGLATSEAWISILYAGIMSSGVAYTLQVVAQKDLNPAVASLIMSLESVFSVLAGWVLLGQKLSARELVGCAMIFAAVVLAQIPFEELKKAHRKA